MRVGFLLGAIAAIAVVAILVMGIVVVSIPDANTPTGEQGQASQGYVDPSIVVTYYVPTGGNTLNGEITKVNVIQHLSQPAGPVTTIVPPGSATIAACTSYVIMFVSGPGTSFSKKSESQGIPQAGGQATFLWGHVYLFEVNGRYTFTFEAYMSGCGYTETVFLDSHPWTFTFNGQN